MKKNMGSVLRESIARGKPLLVAGAHNGVSARLVERNGFDAVWASSFEISTSYCVPDASILSMSEFLEASRTMADVVNVPIIADCDSGYGDAANVYHMTRKFEAAGVAAVCIEDKEFPKTNSFIEGRQNLASVESFVEKIQSAVRGRSSDMMIFARIEALVSNQGMEEALRRAHAYADAQADVVLIHSKSRTPDEVLEFARRWANRTPLAIIPTTYFGITPEQIRDAGVQLVIYANHAMRSAVRAMDHTLAQIAATRSSQPVEGEIASMKDLFDLQGMNELTAMRAMR
jgi:phosphoenolpyruvate phosphomutase